MTPIGTINLTHFWHFRLITKQQNFLLASQGATVLLSLLNWYWYFIVERAMQTAMVLFCNGCVVSSMTFSHHCAEFSEV